MAPRSGSHAGARSRTGLWHADDRVVELRPGVSGCQDYDNSITGSNYTVRKSLVQHAHASEGPRVAGSNILIEDNLIGSMCSNSGDHADGIQGYGGGTNIVISHMIDLRTAKDVTSLIFFADGSQSADVQNNLVAGGGFLRLHDDLYLDHGPWVLKGNRIVNGAWSFGSHGQHGHDVHRLDLFGVQGRQHRRRLQRHVVGPVVYG